MEKSCYALKIKQMKKLECGTQKGFPQDFMQVKKRKELPLVRQRKADSIPGITSV